MTVSCSSGTECLCNSEICNIFARQYEKYCLVFRMEHVSKSQQKLIRSLRLKKFRDESGLFVAEGVKCVEELRKGFELVLLVNHDNATEKEIEQMSALKTPQGIIAIFRQHQATNLPTAGRQGEVILALDGIQDPGNIGTIIRTADWFGITDIVCSADTADCYNPKVVQATMGSLTRVHVHYTDLVEWLGKSANSDIYGTMLDGRNIYEETLSKPAIIIMGNEGNGISPEVRRLVTHPLLIPSFRHGEHAESLNVGIATALTLAEFCRR